MEIQVTQQEWLKQPFEVRQKLAEVFQVPRSSGTVMMDNKVQTDGYTYHDLQAITVEKMRSYLEENKVDDFGTLWDLSVEKAVKELTPVVEAPKIDLVQLQLDEWVAVLNRMKAQANDKGLAGHLEEIAVRIFDLKKPLTVNTNVPKKGRKKAK